MSEVNLAFKGLNPLDQTKEEMEQILMPLKYILPPDSDIKVSMNKYRKNFEGSVLVRSPLGDFAAQANGHDILSLTKSLRDTVKQQIFKFRQTHHTWKKAA